MCDRHKKKTATSPLPHSTSKGPDTHGRARARTDTRGHARRRTRTHEPESPDPPVRVLEVVELSTPEVSDCRQAQPHF